MWGGEGQEGGEEVIPPSLASLSLSEPNSGTDLHVWVEDCELLRTAKAHISPCLRQPRSPSVHEAGDQATQDSTPLRSTPALYTA